MNARQLLQSELARRCERNPRYSLRAFAKALGISHTVLSLVLSGKRPLSKKAFAKVSEALDLQTSSAQPNEDLRQLSLDTFSVVSDWYHYGILSLLELPRAKLDARWIAARLGITQVQAKLAIERLQRLELIEPVGKNRWRQSGKPLRVGNSVSTEITRKFHRQLLEKAVESLENHPVELRDFSAMTFALNPSQIPYARERIRDFRRELVRDLEAKASPTHVYEFTVQMFPVSQPESKPNL
jgi:uncharacterized protein (TIGR02147 family)